MARFILDIDKLDSIPQFMKEICEQYERKSCVRVVCIDETCENQFYVDEQENKLTKSQLDNYQKFLDENSKETLDISVDGL